MSIQNPIEVDQTFGHWRVVRVAGRRALARCRCGGVFEVSTESLLSGESTSCGCSALSRPKSSQAFRLPSWLPERGR
jgi:hypothetical protein